MLKVLIKKQLTEVFKSYFYDAKNNRMRSKWAVAGWFVFFIAIMAGLLGGMFTALALSMCPGLTAVGMGWLYFLLMGGIAIILGAFGSVFNSYSGLYLAKDGDLLLSMPIPVKTVIAARLTNVYLMGAMYAATVMLPALIVYWITAGPTVARVICGILLFLIVTVIVLLLSAILGWVVAKISLKLKNKSFITVLASLLFIVAYYVVYFRASDMVQDIIQNAGAYGTQIKGASYALYLFGRTGEGDWMAAAIYLAVTALCFAGVWIVLSRSFLNIATASGKTGKVRYTEKAVKEKTPFGALLSKEFARFTSNPSYMLNCGLGVLLIPACAVLFLIKGREIAETLNQVFSGMPDCAAVLLCASLCLLSSMNNMATPSVSLEGKSIWIPQSLPVQAKTVLRAKTSVQMLLTAIPMLLAVICTAAVVPASLPVKLLLCIMPLLYSVFSAVSGTVAGVRMPILNWTNELAPIKQSGAIMITLFGGWLLSIALAGLYLLVGYKIGATLYLLLWSALFAVLSLILLKWLDTKGAAAFSAL
ncbi:MAG: hypothetical protein K6B40_07065 [Firmicutes bacterium]|nr:hypothetical protein [Bacillota bacterium]